MSSQRKHNTIIGRPPSGKLTNPAVTARLPREMVAEVESFADSLGVTRSEALCRLVREGLKRLWSEPESD